MPDLQSNTEPPIVIVVAGEGGHCAQAQQFCAGLEDRGIRVRLFTEHKSCLIPPVSRWSKEGNARFWLSVAITAIWFPAALGYAILSRRMRSATLVVSFGPMAATPLIFAAQTIGRPVMFIESWSRFESISLTGRIHRRLGARFLIQNPMTLVDGDKPDCLGRLG